MVHAMRKLLAKHCVGPYSTTIEEFALVLRIDGKMVSWNFERCEELKLNRRERYITIDIGVPKERWQGNDGASISTYLVDCVEEALKLMVDKLQRSNLDVEADQLFADFDTVRGEYLAQVRAVAAKKPPD